MIKKLLQSLTLSLSLLTIMPIIGCSTQSTNPSGCQENEQSEITNLFSQVALPTYKVLASEGEFSWSGSAVAYDKRHLVTAAHVVLSDLTGQPVDKLYIFNKLGRHKVIAEVRVIKFSKENDLALIETTVDVPYVAAFTSPKELKELGWGSLVVASGYSLGIDDQVVTEGRVTSTDLDGFILYSAPTMPGNSGGPVFHRFRDGYKVFSISQAGFIAGGPVAHMGLGVNPYVLYNFMRN